MKTYLIKEIFGPTIQGEGSHVGSVVKFLRFSGCNRWTGLKKDREKATCWFCDTDFRGGGRLSSDEIILKLESLGPCKRVVISGGEATLQLDREILERLKCFGYEIHLETNGSKSISALRDLIDHVSMSPKQGPEATQIEACDDLKVLFPSPIPGVTPRDFASFPAKARFLQPIDGPDIKKNTDDAVRFCLENPGWKLSVQTHKLLGVQ